MNDKILFVDDKWKEDEWDIEFKKRMPKEWEFIYEQRGDNTLQQIKKQPDIKVVLLDLNFEGQHKQGEEILKEIKIEFPAIPVIILTAINDVPTARKLCFDGGMASQYIIKSKNLDYEKLKLEISGCIELYNLQTDNIRKTDKGIIIGKSKAIEEVLQLIRRVCKRDTPVLITGESGTGKELVARAIHINSDRKDKPFIARSCADLPESTIESELFGHVRGAFTHAIKEKKGIFELADGGTIFLDEIGELKRDIQAKFLRVLEEQEVQRVGSEETTQVDIRVIAATNRNLEEEIKQKNFREDLYYRLNVFLIHVLPLRERREDIPLLAKYFVNYFNTEHRLGKEVNDAAMELLASYNWPGNIRELRNTLERIMLVSDTDVLDKESFSFLNQSRDEKDDGDAEDSVWAEKLVNEEKKWDDLMENFAPGRHKKILKKALIQEEKLSGSWGATGRLANKIGINRSQLSQLIGEKRDEQRKL